MICTNLVNGKIAKSKKKLRTWNLIIQGKGATSSGRGWKVNTDPKYGENTPVNQAEPKR
jgi:hypothetical protein